MPQNLKKLLHEKEKRITPQALDELIRLLKNAQDFESLSDNDITWVGNYHAIRLNERPYFNKAFTTGKEVATILRIAEILGRKEVLADLLHLQKGIRG